MTYYKLFSHFLCVMQIIFPFFFFKVSLCQWYYYIDYFDFHFNNSFSYCANRKCETSINVHIFRVLYCLLLTRLLDKHHLTESLILYVVIWFLLFCKGKNCSFPTFFPNNSMQVTSTWSLSQKDFKRAKCLKHIKTAFDSLKMYYQDFR